MTIKIKTDNAEVVGLFQRTNVIFLILRDWYESDSSVDLGSHKTAKGEKVYSGKKIFSIGVSPHPPICTHMAFSKNSCGPRGWGPPAVHDSPDHLLMATVVFWWCSLGPRGVSVTPCSPLTGSVGGPPSRVEHSDGPWLQPYP